MSQGSSALTDHRAGRSEQCGKQGNDLIVPLGGLFPGGVAREAMRERDKVSMLVYLRERKLRCGLLMC